MIIRVVATMPVIIVKLTNTFLQKLYNSVSNLTGNCVKHVKESSVSDHLLQCDSTINFDHFDVLASYANSFSLVTKKSLVIKRGKPALNRTVKSLPLKLFD